MRTFLLFISLAFITHYSFSQESEIDLNDLINDSQIHAGDQGEIKLNWWIPTEFWVATFQNEPGIPDYQVDEFVNILKPYTIFAVIDGDIGTFGGVEYTPLSEIEKNISMIGTDGKTYKPLKHEELSMDVQNFLSMFKPVLINMIGQMGENMHFFVFEDLTKTGKRLADPNADGQLQVNVMDEEYIWQTPLPSLLPPKFCPVDKEEMKGSWKYCPYHGDELLDEK
jgi:hypothetical protein